MTDLLPAHLNELRRLNYRPTTIRQRRDALRRLTAELHPTGLLDATPTLLADWQDRRVHRVTPATRRAEISHARSFYAWAVRQGHLTRSPVADLGMPRIPRRMPRPIGEEALRFAILTATPRVRAVLTIAAYAGLRCGEIALLQRHDVIDLADPPVLHVRDGKGGHGRVVPMSTLVLDALHAYGMPAKGYVFPRADGQPGPNRPARMSRICNEHLHAMGIPETLHQLRHRLGTVLYEQTQDLRLVQEVLGHSSPATTAGYVAWSSRKAADALQAITDLSLLPPTIRV